MFSTETWMWEEKQLRVVVHPCVWWLKSCTTLDVWNPKNHGINYQPQLVSLPDFFPSTVGWVSSSSEFQSLCCCSTAAPLMTCLENSTSNNPGGVHVKTAAQVGEKICWESLPIWPCHTRCLSIGPSWKSMAWFPLKSPGQKDQFPKKKFKKQKKKSGAI